MELMEMAAAQPLGSVVQKGELKLELYGKGMRGNHVRVAVYSSNAPEQFLSDEKFYRGMVRKARSERLIVSVPDLPPGKYAVAAYVDSNKNGKLDQSSMGVPTKHYGFSNEVRGMFNAHGMFVPPTFSQAAFDFGVSPVTISIHLQGGRI